MSKKLKVPKPNKGYGYVGVYNDGYSGRFMPRHISGKLDRKSPGDGITEETIDFMHGERLFLCEITVKPILDKKRRPITKVVKKINPR